MRARLFLVRKGHLKENILEKIAIAKLYKVLCVSSCCESFPLRRFGDALFAPNYSCDDLTVDIFISATRLVMASSPYLKMLTRTNVI